MKKQLLRLLAAGALLFAVGFSQSALAIDAPTSKPESGAMSVAPAAAPAAGEAAPAAAPAAAAPATAAPAAAAEAAPAAAPVPNKGDTSWMMISTALVIMMS